MRTFLLALALMVSPVVAHGAEAPLSADESAKLEAFASHLVDTCKTQVLEKAKQTAAGGGSGASWTAAIASDAYCECVGQEVRARSTPTLLRSGSPEAAQRMVQDGASECAARQFRETFPRSCGAMVAELASRSGATALDEARQRSVCECVKPRVDSVTGDTLAATLQATVRDYTLWLQTPGQAPMVSPGSMMGAYYDCFKAGGLVR